METEEQKLLEIYRSKRASLTQELDILEELINLIETRQMIYGESTTPNLDIQTLEQINVNNVKHGFSSRRFIFNKNTGFRPSMTYNEKIIFALGKLDTATVYEIIDFLGRYETPKDEDVDKYFNGLTMAASNMYVKREIYAQKQGRRNKYSLTPFPDEEPEEEDGFMK